MHSNFVNDTNILLTCVSTINPLKHILVSIIYFVSKVIKWNEDYVNSEKVKLRLNLMYFTAIKNIEIIVLIDMNNFINNMMIIIENIFTKNTLG